jgi:hypothetical protein
VIFGIPLDTCLATFHAQPLSNALPQQYPGLSAHTPNSLHIGWSMTDKNVWSAEVQSSAQQQQQQTQIITPPLSTEEAPH